MKNSFAFLLLAAFLLGCGVQKNSQTEVNPPAPGFNAKGSDPKAIQIADEVMAAMGGRKNWDDARYISWMFFGRRKHTWDKHTGDIRIESPGEKTTYLLNINTLAGKVRRNGVVETNPDTLKMLLDDAKSFWINDAYWLVMPYKLKDSGVTLKYLGEGKTEAGAAADILQLTFEKVGKTPENMYHVFVDKTSRLVTQWSYFKNASDEKPGFTSPWEGYQKHGNIMLCGGRGKGSLTEISAPEKLTGDIFTKFD